MNASTGIVILAAGESARMGGPKQLLMFRGKTLLQHAIDTALSISGAPVVVVLGAHAAQIRARLDAPWTAAACCRRGGGQPATRGAEQMDRPIAPHHTQQAAPSAQRQQAAAVHGAGGTFDHHPVMIVAENPGWRDGMGSSLRTGLGTLLTAHPSISAAIFMVCDQPLLTASTLSILIATHQQSGSAIVASEYGDRSCDVLAAGSSRGVLAALGVPALFARSMFPELLALEGNEGARQLIHAHRDQAIAVPFPDGSVDLDTPADYAPFSENSHALSV